jgi:HAE1 family hydrophobic/amphiphilic exporter-1
MPVDRPAVAHSHISVICALILIGVPVTACRGCRPVSFRSKTKGYLLVRRAIARWRALDRTQHVLTRVSEITRQGRGVEQVITMPAFPRFDNSSSLANAGVAYLISRSGARAARARICARCSSALNEKLSVIEEARILVVPPPANPGHRQRRRLRHAGAAARRQFRFRPSSGDCRRRWSSNASSMSALQRVSRRSVRRCQLEVEVDRIKAQTCMSRPTRIFSTLSSYMGSILRQPVQQVRSYLPGLCHRRMPQFRLTRA